MSTKFTTKKIIGIAAVIILMLAAAFNVSGTVGIIKNFFTVLTPVLVGVCLGFILNILVKFFESKVFAFLNHTKKPRPTLAKTLSIVCTYLVFFGAIALLLLVVIPQVTKTVSAILAGFPAFTERALAFGRELLERFNLTSDRITNILLGGEDFLDKAGDFIAQAGNFIKNTAGSFVVSVSSFGGSLISGVVNTFLGLFLSVYFLSQRDLILRQIRRFLGAVMKESSFGFAHKVFKLSCKAFENFISGQLIEALILGSLCFVGMLIFRIPYAPVVSVLVGVSALIPILGAWIGGGISAMLILIADPIKSLWFLIFLVVLQQLEGNLIYPRVVGKQVGLPGVWVLLAVIVGNGFFGTMGALIAVPVASILYSLAAEFTAFVENKKKAQ